MSSRCPRKALYRPKKWHFQKPQKTFSFFFRFLGPRGLPREPQETQEGSQKAPKELQNLQKRTPKIDLKKVEFWTVLGPFWRPFWEPKVDQKGAKKGPQKWPQKCDEQRPSGPAKIVRSRPVLGPFPPRSYTPNRTCTPKRLTCQTS